MNLTRLKVNSQYRPTVDAAPYFSWVLESEKQNVMQTSYRLVVKSGGREFWDSGVVESSRSTFVLYAGAGLEGCRDYIWRVTVCTNSGENACAEGSFETALIAQNWQARWVRSPRKFGKTKPGFGKQPPAELFRRVFTSKEIPVRARVYATCHGSYLLSINGVRPDDRAMAPEHTQYAKQLCYQTYDITALVQPGENVLGMFVGDGWYNSPNFKPAEKGFRPEHAVLFQILLEYPDGTRQIIGSDAQVRTSPGPVLSSEMFSGELYDANLEQDGWDCAGFRDENWQNAIVAKTGFDNLTAQYGEPVRPTRKLPVAAMTTSPRGETILDFGQVMAGVVEMRAALPRGLRLELDCFETTDQYGNYYCNILDMGKSKRARNGPASKREQQIVYISNGKEAVYRPHFTFLGFRYVRVRCAQPVRAEDFCAVVISSDCEELGVFSCSDERLNRLYENTLWSQRSNMVSIPTDCPQREKAGWTGDIQIYASTALLNANVTPFLTRWLQNLTHAQHPNGAVPMVVPFNGMYPKLDVLMGLMGKNHGPMGVAGWGDAACIVPWTMYTVTGNIHVLRNQYDSMKAWCGYVIGTAEKYRGQNKLPREIDRCLWNTGFHYGEWLIPSQSGNGFDKTAMKSMASKAYTAPIFGWNSCRIMAETAKLLGNEQDHAYYADAAAKMKLAIQQGVIGKDGSMPTDFMGAYVLILAFDLVPEHLKQNVADRLIRKIEENSDCLDTGFLATPYLLDALCKIGRLDKAYTILLQDRCPSWLYEIKQGATTIWENYTSYKPDGTPLKTSLNHYAFGCVDDWMFRNIGGIAPVEPGFRQFRIEPKPTAQITWARRSYQSEYGRISAEWHTTEEGFRLQVSIPCNTQAAVVLPDGRTEQVGSGEYSFCC